ncbi:MAG: hypothetical protein LBV23_09785 [Deltaproteobacteria bacterium]|nr:hypothetical protein [Deltaproteobacteria bacterium]
MKKILRQAFDSWLTITKLTIPALVLVKLLTWLDLIEVISKPFEPLMTVMGLPKELSLFWVTSMLTNIYAGVAVLVHLLPLTGPLDSAAATVAGALVLIAHNLPVESAVCHAAGVSYLRVTIYRIAASFVYATLIHLICRSTGWGAQPASIFIPVSVEHSPDWLPWLFSSLKTLTAMFFIVLFLLLFMTAIKKIGLLKIFSALLSPLMRFSAISDKALLITVIGMLVGLAYGGGLIIAQTRQNEISKIDVFGSITLLAVCHSILEDTILVSCIGGSLWGLLVGRLAFALALTAILVRLARRKRGRVILLGR